MIVKRNFLRSLLIAIVLTFAWRAEAQPLVLSSNRWLIVVDTSLSMNTRLQAAVDSVEAMLFSSMNGQLRPGDTIGIWTFNETLTKGRFPLQLWHPEVTQTIAARAGEYIKAQKLQKTANFDCVIPDINRLVTNSDILTVILLTDGDTQIKGTPFDKSINTTFKKDYRTQKKAHAPFILAFRSEGGKMTGLTMTPAPWLATFPALPPAPAPVAEKEAPTPAVAVAPTPELAPAVVPNLILTGKKDESTNAAETTATPEAQAPITLNSNTIPTLAPEPTLINTQDIATVAIETQAVETASVDTNVPPPENVTTQTAPQIPETPTAPTVETPPTPMPTESIPVDTTVPVQDATKTEIAKFEADHTDDVKTISSSAQPLVANPVPSSAKQPTAIVVAATKENTPPVSTAIVAAPNSGNQTRLMLGIGLVVIAIGIGIFWMRKSRPAPSGSLITRSIDKDKRDS